LFLFTTNVDLKNNSRNYKRNILNFLGARTAALLCQFGLDKPYPWYIAPRCSNLEIAGQRYHYPASLWAREEFMKGSWPGIIETECVLQLGPLNRKRSWFLSCKRHNELSFVTAC